MTFLAHIPHGEAVHRSNRANAAQVERLREAVKRTGSYARAGEEVGFKRQTVRHIAHRSGFALPARDGRPAPILPYHPRSRTHNSFATGYIPREIAQRGPRWREAYSAEWDAQKAAGAEDGWAQWHATHAADAAILSGGAG